MAAHTNTCKASQDVHVGTERGLPVPVRPAQPIARIAPSAAPGSSLADLGPLLDKKQAAKRIARSESWLNQAFARGDFPRPIYIGRNVAWPQRWVDEWIAAQVAAQVPLDRQPNRTTP